MNGTAGKCWHPVIWGAKTQDYGVQGHPSLHGECLVSLGYIVKPCLKINFHYLNKVMLAGPL